jgi:hypothetical protein
MSNNKESFQHASDSIGLVWFFDILSRIFQSRKISIAISITTHHPLPTLLFYSLLQLNFLVEFATVNRESGFLLARPLDCRRRHHV